MPFAYYFIHDIRLLIAIRFFHGFATAIYGPVAMAVIMDIAGEKKGQLIGTYSSASILGGMIAAPLGGGLLQWLGGNNPAPSVFRQIYLVVGLIGSVSLVLVIVLWRRLPSRASPDPPSVAEVMRKFREDVVAVLTDSQVLLTSGMEGVQNLTVGALEAFLPVYVTVTAGLTSFHAGILWGVQLVMLFSAWPHSSSTPRRRTLFSSWLSRWSSGWGSPWSPAPPLPWWRSRPGQGATGPRWGCSGASGT
jgi:MFS family permease